MERNHGNKTNANNLVMAVAINNKVNCLAFFAADRGHISPY